MTTATDDAIFDAAKYDLPIPTQDGHKADRIALNVGGSVDIDRTDEQGLEFVNGLRIGQEVELLITCTVTRKGFTFTAGKEENPDQTGYGVGLKVTSCEPR